MTHHIRIEGNVLAGQDGGTADRRHLNQNADLGMDHPEQPDSSAPEPAFIWVTRTERSHSLTVLIENNLIQDTIGYNMEIKDQISIPEVPGMPTGPTSTIIRNNVFVKDDQPSPDGNRPNLLVGAFPTGGPGSHNLYEIYGNFFFHNHRDALFQGSGRISLHDNVFVDGPYDYPAVVLRRQSFPLRVAYVYNNTIYTTERGIHFGTPAVEAAAV